MATQDLLNALTQLPQGEVEAILPALTNMMQQGGFNPTSSTENLYTGMLTDDRGKEQQAGVGQGVKGMQYKVGESPIEELMHQAQLAEMNRGSGLLGGPIKQHGDGQRGELDAAAAAGGWNPNQPNLEGDPGWIPNQPADPVVPLPPNYGVPSMLPPGPPVTGPETAGQGPIDLSKIPSDLQPLVQPPPLTRTRLPLPTEQLPQERLEEFKGASLAPPIGAGLTAQVTPGGGTTRTIDRRDYQGTREAPDPVVSDPRDAGDIENNLDDQQKNDLNNIKNEVNTYLNNVGWSDSGDWGYARTRNLLTGGGLGSVVTQGPMVPWQSMGGDASSADYISNVGGRDIMPSRLAPGERLGETTSSSEINYVPDSEKADYLKTNYGTREGNEGASMFNTQHLNLTGADIGSIPGGLTDLNFIGAKALANRNTIASANFNADSFKGLDTVKGFVGKVLSPLKAGADAVGNLLTYVTDGLGLTDADVKDPNFFTWLNTPISAISTSEIGIKPLDVIMVAAGGMPAFGAVVMGKVMDGLLKPFTSRIKGAWKAIFKGDDVEGLSDADKSDAMGEWERTMNVQEEDTNTYDPNNKLDVLMSGDYFISDPDRADSEQAKNWMLDSFNNGDMMNLSGKRVAIFTNNAGNVINTNNLNVREGTTDIVPGPNNTAWGISGGAAYEIKTLNGSNVIMNEWNDGRTNDTGGGSKGVLKTLWEWVTSKQG